MTEMSVELNLLRAFARLVPRGTNGADNPFHRVAAKTVNKQTATQIRSALVLDHKWSSDELLEIADSLMADAYGAEAWAELFQGKWGKGSKPSLPALSADSWLMDFVDLSPQDQQAQVVWIFKQLTPVDMVRTATTGYASGNGEDSRSMTPSRPVTTAAPQRVHIAAAGGRGDAEEEEEEVEDGADMLERVALDISPEAAYAVLAQFVGVENKVGLAAALLHALPSGARGRNARKLMQTWISAEHKYSREQESAIALAKAQGLAKRRGDKVDISGKAHKKRRRNRCVDSDCESDDESGKRALHLADFCSEFYELNIVQDPAYKDRLKWLGGGSIGAAVKLLPFAMPLSRAVVRLESDRHSGVEGPKSVSAFLLQLKALRALTTSERTTKKLTTFHGFLDRIGVLVKRWEEESMDDRCLIPELPIFMSRWETSVERVFKTIAKASPKTAKRAAKAIFREMTSQANSRLVVLGGMPALLWEEDAKGTSRPVPPKSNGGSVCAKHVGKVEGIDSFERGCGKTEAACGRAHIVRRQNPAAFAEALRYIQVSWPNGLPSTK